MKCLSCDVILSESEQNRKYKNYEEIKNPEDRFINLCDSCLYYSDLDVDNLTHHRIVPTDIGDLE